MRSPPAELRRAVRRGTLARCGLCFVGYVTILPHPHGKQGAPGRRTRGGPRERHKCRRTPRRGRKVAGGRPAGAGAQGGAQRPRWRRVPASAIGVGGTGPPAPASCGRAHSYAPPLQVVVNPKRHEAGSRSPWVFGVPRIRVPAYRLRRIVLPRTPVNSGNLALAPGTSRTTEDDGRAPARVGGFRT